MFEVLAAKQRADGLDQMQSVAMLRSFFVQPGVV